MGKKIYWFVLLTVNEWEIARILDSGITLLQHSYLNSNTALLLAKNVIIFSDIYKMYINIHVF